MTNKNATKDAYEVELTRKLLKQFLYALCVSEGFGERRLMRVLLTWTEIYKEVKGANENDAMLTIDSILDKVMPSKYVKAIGYEKLKDSKGRIINGVSKTNKR